MIKNVRKESIGSNPIRKLLWLDSEMDIITDYESAVPSSNLGRATIYDRSKISVDCSEQNPKYLSKLKRTI